MTSVLLLGLFLACTGDAPDEAGPAYPGFVAPRQADADEIAMLEAIGYVGEGAPTDKNRSGVTVNEPGAWPGRNLVTGGHGTDVTLVDMDGNVLHTWSASFRDVDPRRWISRQISGADHLKEHHYRRARVTPEGDLLVMFGGLMLARLDKTSRVLWTYDARVHHDIDLAADGTIYTLSRHAEKIRRMHPKRSVVVDDVVVLSPEGRVLREVNLFEALASSPFASLLDTLEKRHGDIFHTNTIRVLEGEPPHPAFQPGRVLVSLRELDAIGVVDLDLGQFVWVHRDTYDAQHDPQLTADGTIVLFDNKGLGDASRIVEYDLSTEPPSLVWRLDGSATFPFFSPVCGAVDRLPNGNTLVSETNAGRAFEVTPDKRVVWEYYIPHRAGSDGELIARLFELQRLPADFGDAWLTTRP